MTSKVSVKRLRKTIILGSATGILLSSVPVAYLASAAAATGHQPTTARALLAAPTPAGVGLWTTSTQPQYPASLDTLPLELGTTFTPRRSGMITGIGFYKGTGNTGTHTGTLWNANRKPLARVTFTNETATGWQFATFSKPIPVSAGQKYVASYFAPRGRFALTTNYFSTQGHVTNDLLTTTGAGAYQYGASSFPTNSSTSNYWVDVRFVAATQSTAPTPTPTPTPTPSQTPTPTPTPTQTPTPTPTPTPSATGRDKFKQPFTSTSIWNMPIGSNAQYKALNLSPPLTSYGLVSVYLSFDQQAPLRKLVDRGYYWPWVSGTTTPGTDTGFQVRIPDEMVIPPPPAPAFEDRPAAALQADGLAREFQYTVRPRAGSDISMFEGVRAAFRLDGDGLTPPGQSGAHGGSGLTTLGGTLRKGELSGSDPIRHPLAVTMNLTKWGTVNGGNIKNGYRWPALWADTAHANPAFAVGYGSLSSLGYTGRDGLGEGSLVALPTNVDLASLKFETREGAKLAWTYQNYGAYVVDNAGDTGSYDVHRLNIEAGVEKESPVLQTDDKMGTPFTRDMDKIFTRLAVVDNNTPSTIGGGGTPLQPLAPPLMN